MTDTRLTVDHNLAEEFHEWVYLPTYRGEAMDTWRDALGRRNNGGAHRWLILICNNIACPARCLVRANIVERVAEREHPVPTPIADPEEGTDD